MKKLIATYTIVAMLALVGTYALGYHNGRKAGIKRGVQIMLYLMSAPVVAEPQEDNMREPAPPPMDAQPMGTL